MWSISKLVVTAAWVARHGSRRCPSRMFRQFGKNPLFFGRPEPSSTVPIFKLPPETDSAFFGGFAFGYGYGNFGQRRATYVYGTGLFRSRKIVDQGTGCRSVGPRAGRTLTSKRYYARLVRKELSRMQVKGRPFDAIRRDADAILTHTLTERTKPKSGLTKKRATLQTSSRSRLGKPKSAKCQKKLRHTQVKWN